MIGRKERKLGWWISSSQHGRMIRRSGVQIQLGHSLLPFASKLRIASGEKNEEKKKEKLGGTAEEQQNGNCGCKR